MVEVVRSVPNEVWPGLESHDIIIFSQFESQQCPTCKHNTISIPVWDVHKSVEEGAFWQHHHTRSCKKMGRFYTYEEAKAFALELCKIPYGRER